MIGWLGDGYLWVKAAHVAIVFFWIAGLFALPRYLIYMHSTKPGSVEEAQWTSRCNRLRNIILTPALILSWIFGLSLAFNIGFSGNLWLHWKIGIVVLLSIYHMWMVRLGKKMSLGQRPVAEKTLRIANEAPALATIAIVIFVIVRPF
ncbi:putative membrane protein [Rhodoblastus acidophilus]|uniref:CopD family protein n=1 Tax=Rhodoblastus acidophilus TaxID=1074 RepID=UPI0016199AAA|nr:CopD family protein [Rhodoblastus acidophilus]MCW2284468.1 putative membrane protein [Rhodoblastus acidophilus]MCW2333315.1 putative membrane protein [Rhodoblastus acidophilus]